MAIATVGPGRYLEMAAELRPDSIQLLREVQCDRKNDARLRDYKFFGGDCALYGLVDDQVMLYLADSSQNPFLSGAVSHLVEQDLGNLVGFNLSELKGRPNFISRKKGKVLRFDVPLRGLSQGRERFLECYGEDIARFTEAVHGQEIYGRDTIFSPFLEEGYTEIDMFHPGPVRQYLMDKPKGSLLACICVTSSREFRYQANLAGMDLNWHDPKIRMRGVRAQ